MTNKGGELVAVGPEEEERGDWGYVRVVPDPGDLSNRVLPRRFYRLELAVTARDVDSRKYVMDVEYDGVYRWPQEFWAGMTLTLQHSD